MSATQPAQTPIANPLILNLKKDGWDIHKEDGALMLVVLTGQNEGVAFNVFLDNFDCWEGRLFFDEFKMVDGQYVSEQGYPPQDVNLVDLPAMVAPYIRRGHDWTEQFAA